MALLLPPTFSPPFRIYSKFNHCMLPSLCWSILNLFFSWFFIPFLPSSSRVSQPVNWMSSLFNFSTIFHFSTLVIFSRLLFNMLQAQNCSQEGDYGRQKSSHYRRIIQRGHTLLEHNHLQLPAHKITHRDSQKYQQVLKRIKKHWLMQGHTTSTRKQSKVPRSTRLWTKPPAWGFAAIAANFLPNHQLQDFREGGKCWRALALLLSPHCLLCSWFKLEIDIVIFGHSEKKDNPHSGNIDSGINQYLTIQTWLSS